MSARLKVSAGLVLLLAAAGAFVFHSMHKTGAAAAGGRAGPGGGMPPATVLAVPVERAPAVDTVQVVGTLLADESVIVRSEIAGRIVDLPFTEGQSVKKGDLLVRLNADEWQAAVRENEATVSLQQSKMKRATELREKKAVSQQEYDESHAALDEARAALELSRARLAKTVLRAPFDGILGLRRVSPGDYVEAGQDIVNLEAIDPLKVEFGIPERYASALHPGQSVDITVDAFPGESFSGEVYAVNPRVDPDTRRVQMRARIDNSGARLRPGMFADVALVFERREQALWVPEQAIVPTAGQDFVFRVVDGHAVRTPIVMGLRKPGRVEIRSGLSAGDTVVTEGQLKLRDGAPVQPREASGAVTPPG